MKTTPRCKLCHEERELCASHVFPEFLYTSSYDDKHRALSLSTSSARTRFVQKGIRERLLCRECEQFLSTAYEDYFARFWFQTAPLPNPASSGPYELTGFDYTKFKLFHLSVLWRTSVASGSAFQQANLGPHEAKVRRMLRDQNAGEPYDYPVLASIWAFPDTKRPAQGTVMPPIFTRSDGHGLYAMIYGGCVWHVVVSSKRIGHPLTVGMLTRESVLMPVWTLDQFAPMKNFYRQHLAAPS